MDYSNSIRPVYKVDIDNLAQLLTSAFENDPVIRWFFPEKKQWKSRVPGFFSLHLKLKVRHGSAFTTNDLSGAALWDAPNSFQNGILEKIEFNLSLLRLHGFDLPRVSKGRKSFEELHPDFPHWYLSVLGVDPDVQGRGIGTSLIQPMLKKCDSEGLPVYVETAQERGVHFYKRLGFEITGEYNLPQGPLFYTLLRKSGE